VQSHSFTDKLLGTCIDFTRSLFSVTLCDRSFYSVTAPFGVMGFVADSLSFIITSGRLSVHLGDSSWVCVGVYRPFDYPFFKYRILHVYVLYWSAFKAWLRYPLPSKEEPWRWLTILLYMRLT